MHTFYLGSIFFPISPATLNIRINNQNKTVTLMNEGEINILKSEKLKDISFEVLIPNQRYPFAKYLGGVLPMQYYTEQISTLKNLKKPVQFIVLRKGSSYSTNLKVSIEDYEITEDADSLGRDIKISLKLKEYKDKSNLLMQVIGLVNGVYQYVTNESRESNKTTPKTYTVKNGDTLYSIAKKQLGDGSYTSKLQELNKLPNSIDLTAGQVIRLE